MKAYGVLEAQRLVLVVLVYVDHFLDDGRE